MEEARDYALTGGGSGCIIHHGKQVLAWGDRKQLYDLKSSAKSFGVTVPGLALMDGKVKLDDPAKEFFPAFGVPPEENAQTGWLDKITLRMLATQTAGFEKPGGFGRLLFEPGTQWHYSDGGHYDVLRPFLEPIVASVKDCVECGRGLSAPASPDHTSSTGRGAEAPPTFQHSPVIREIRWAPKATIIRRATLVLKR